MLRKPHGRTQAVVRADAHPTLAREPVKERTRLARLPAAPEPSSVQVHQRGATRRVGAMTVDIEQISFPRVAVADVRQPLDIATTDGKRPEQNSGPWQAAARLGGRPGGDGAAPPGTKALTQCVVHRRVRPQAPPGDDHEPDRRQHRQTERHPTTRRVDITLAERQQCRGKQPRERNERQLVEQIAETKAQVRWARLARPRRGDGEQRAPRHERHSQEIPNRHSWHCTTRADRGLAERDGGC